MKYFLTILLSLCLSIAGHSQLLANQGSFQSSYVSSVSPRSYTQVTYSTSPSKVAQLYIPPGYSNNSNNYPLLVFMPGYGATDRSGGSYANINNSGEGLGYFLTQGDNPPDILIIIPQNFTFGVDYGSTEFNAAITYMTAHYRVNTNRVYASGLSGGAIGCRDVIQNSSSAVAAVLPVSGPNVDGTNWGAYNGIGFWQHHGASDGTFGLTIGGTLYWAGGFYSSAIDLTPAPRTTYYFGKGHSSSVWDTEVYNRLERTDATGTAKFDFIRWLKKYSKDASERATLFVENAEYTDNVVDYREALMLVNNLSSGTTKTNLLARLVTQKAVVDKAGTRYIVSANTLFYTVSLTGINDWNATFAAGQGLTNLVDDTGGSSSLSFTVTNQFASSVRDNNAGDNNAGRQKFKGFKLEYNLSGLVLSHSITNGRLTISNIPSGKKIDVIIHHYHLTGDGDGSAMSVQSAISATMNSTTKTQYSAYNNAYFLEFDDVPESSGSATLDMKTVSTRDVVVTGFEILVHS
jgi:hypothetical protein